MSEQSPQTYPMRQAQLDAAREAFLKSGGTIQVLASFEYKAPPLKIDAGKEPPPAKTRVRRAMPMVDVQLALEQSIETERAELIERAREAAQTMTQTEASRALGVTRKRLSRLAEEGEFTFQVRPTQNLVPKAADPLRDARLAERITALRDVGLSRRQVMAQLSLNFISLNRVIDNHQIDFPKRAKGRNPSHAGHLL